MEDLQLGVYNFQLLRLCSSVCVVMPCAKLIVDSNPTADFCYLHFFFLFSFFSAPAGPSRVAGRDIRHVPSYDGCPPALSNFVCTMRMRGSFRDPRDISLPAFGQMGCPTHTDKLHSLDLNLGPEILVPGTKMIPPRNCFNQ